MILVFLFVQEQIKKGLEREIEKIEEKEKSLHQYRQKQVKNLDGIILMGGAVIGFVCQWLGQTTVLW